jgi:hypothetical protein
LIGVFAVLRIWPLVRLIFTWGQRFRPRKDKRGVDLVSDALPFGRLCYDGPNAVGNSIGYAEHYSRAHDAVIRIYDEAGNVTDTHEHAGELKKL